MGNHNGRLLRLETALLPPTESLVHVQHAYRLWSATLAPVEMIPFATFQPVWFSASRIHVDLQQGYPDEVLLHCCTRECPPLLPALTAYLTGGVERFRDPLWFLLHQLLPFRASQTVYPHFFTTLVRAVRDSWPLVAQRWEGLSEGPQHELVTHWLRLRDLETWTPLIDAYDAAADLQLCQTQFTRCFDEFEQRILRGRWNPDTPWYVWRGQPYRLQPMGHGIATGNADSQSAWQRHAMTGLSQEWATACSDEVRDMDQASLLEQLDAREAEDDDDEG